MYRFSKMLKMDFFNLLFNPMWVFYSTGFPLLLVLILGFLSGGNYGSTVTAYDYYGITMMIYIVLSTATTASNSFMEERIKKGNMRIIYSPIAKPLIYISKILATFIFSFICHLILILLLRFILGVNFGGWKAGFIIVILLLLEFFSSTLGVLLCCILKSENTANQILGIIINIFAVFGGLFFQLDGFGKTIERITYISPAKWAIVSMFKIIYDNNFSYFLPTVSILVGLCVITLLLCGKFYRTEDYI